MRTIAKGFVLRATTATKLSIHATKHRRTFRIPDLEIAPQHDRSIESWDHLEDTRGVLVHRFRLIIRHTAACLETGLQM